MESTVKNRLGDLLRRIQLLIAASGKSSPPPELHEVYTRICKLVFDEKTYPDFWDEPILLQLDWLFQVKPPEPTKFGEQVAELHQQAEHAQRVNDFFFQVLNQDASVEKVFETLAALSSIDPSLLYRLKSSDRLQAIREVDVPPSEKVAAFLDFLKQGVGLDLRNQEPVKGCLDALKEREGAGVVNALLVKASGEVALVVPLQVKVQQGSGGVCHLVHRRQDFEAALERARHSLVERGFIGASDDVLCSLDLTEPEYVGTSIGLAAAVGMYAAARGTIIDPYTAFTGDINLDRTHWRVKGVSGLPQKLEAARRSGCRLVFIPRENSKEVDYPEQKIFRVIPVDDLLEVLLQLQAPLQALLGDSIQVRKINALKAFCRAQGWDLSPSRPIQDGLQLRVVPFHLPELVVNIYNTGAHIPKHHDRPEYQELLKGLQVQEESRIPIRKVEQSFNVLDASLRTEIREALERLQPVEGRQEPYCEYAFRFEQGQECIVVKQYQKGTLQIQGTAGDLFKAILDSIIPRYNLRHPKAQLSIEALLQSEGPVEAAPRSTSPPAPRVQEIPIPHIGTDESGKGDYFGPMVVAAVLVDALIKPKLEALAVRDSKLLSDKRCRELAVQIREITRGKCEEVEISPERYNDLCESFRKEGKNLNHLLAWGHARAIESLLERFSCTHAVADQFGDERYILSKLMEKGKQLKLVQLPKGERYLAVAAASILARDKFLGRLEKLGQEYGIELPKGASDSVVTAAKKLVEMKGPDELRKVAKLHHKTTGKIIG